MKFKIGFTILLICFLSFNRSSAQEASFQKIQSVVINSSSLTDTLNNLMMSNRPLGAIYSSLQRGNIIEVILDRFPKLQESDFDILFFMGVNNKNSHIIVDPKTNEELTKLHYGSRLLVIWLDNLKDSSHYQFSIHIKRENKTFWDYLTSFISVLYQIKQGNLATGKTRGEHAEYQLGAELFNDIGPAPTRIQLTIDKIFQSGKSDEDMRNISDIITVGENNIWYRTRTEITVDNVVKKYFGIKLGASFVRQQDFFVQPKDSSGTFLQVKNGSAHNWYGRPFVLFSLLPGIDNDLEFSKWFWNDFEHSFDRLSLDVGFQLTERPFDELFAGLGFDIIGESSITLGLALMNRPGTNSSFSVDKITLTNLNDLREILPYKYQPSVFIGFSVTTSTIGRLF